VKVFEFDFDRAPEVRDFVISPDEKWVIFSMVAFRMGGEGDDVEEQVFRLPFRVRLTK
jgi:hypothetical protein